MLCLHTSPSNQSPQSICFISAQLVAKVREQLLCSQQTPQVQTFKEAVQGCAGLAQNLHSEQRSQVGPRSPQCGIRPDPQHRGDNPAVLSDHVQSGKYYSDCREAKIHPSALVEAEQERLWNLSSKLVGQTSNISDQTNQLQG